MTVASTSPTITITSLGTSGAGKTCFMLGMYAVMQVGVRGFTFSTPDLDLDLKLTEDWEHLVDTRGEDRWPPLTVESRECVFDFNYGFRKILGFNWFDYRGGALKDQASSEDLQQLIAHMRQSACVFLCVDSSHFAQPVGPRKRKIMDSIGVIRMNQLMQQVHEVGTNPSIAIVLTKYDTCARDPEDVIADVKEVFRPLFVEGSNCLVSICPTSLGKGLHDAPREAEIDPINVHHPVAFAVYGVLGKMLQNSRSRRSEINSRVSQLAGSAFREWWNRDEIAKNHREIALTDSEMEKISAQIELLGSELMQSSRVYYNGKEQTRNAPLGAIGPQ